MGLQGMINYMIHECDYDPVSRTEIDIEKVPLLGDIPFIGRAFRSEGRTRTKTNLMVFLRPTIIRNAEDARPLTQSRLDRMRLEDMNQSGRTTSKIDDILIDPPASRIISPDVNPDE